MCLVFVAQRAHPRYRLVVAANRDEYHARPTAPAGWWAGEPGLFGGRDLQSGGTWMAVTRAGRFAALTNYRGEAIGERAPPSRGELVSGFLRAESGAAEYVAALAARGRRYNGFSLLVHDGEELWCYSNPAERITRVGAGVHGLSNHLLDSPWPKVTRGLDVMRRCLAFADPGARVEALFRMLADRDRPEDHELPDTGVGLARERELAPMFVHGDVYGTRSSTVLLIGARGNIRFEERSFDAAGVETGRVVEAWAAASARERCRA